MADSRTVEGNIKDETGTFCSAKKERTQTNKKKQTNLTVMGHIKRTQKLIERVCNGQNCNNLSNQIDKTVWNVTLNIR